MSKPLGAKGRRGRVKAAYKLPVTREPFFSLATFLLLTGFSVSVIERGDSPWHQADLKFTQDILARWVVADIVAAIFFLSLSAVFFEEELILAKLSLLRWLMEKT